MLSSTTELVGHEYVTSHNPKPLLLYIQADEYEMKNTLKLTTMMK